MPGIMKALTVFTAILAVASCVEECYNNIDNMCASTTRKSSLVSDYTSDLTQCNSKYGAINNVQGDLQQFANSLIYRSFDFLLMATHYGDYIKNRPGFEKLFRGLSDSLWQDGIETIKYITKRGGEMNFVNLPPRESLKENEKGSLELYELQALGRALDIEKQLARDAFKIHKDASGHTHDKHDPEIAHHLEEKFMEKHRDTIRELAGYTKDLKEILDSQDASLGLYMFDEYLQK